MSGPSGGCRSVSCVLGASRDSRYTGIRRGIGASGGIGATRVCRRLLGGFRGCRECQGCIKGLTGTVGTWYSGARRGNSGIRRIGGYYGGRGVGGH